DDLRELGAETSLETCLAQAREVGFEGMELGHKFPREPAALSAVLGRFGLKCVSGWYSARLRERDPRAELALLRPHLELLRALGSEVLVVPGGRGAAHGAPARSGSGPPRLGSSEWREFGRRVTQVAVA